MLNNTRIKTIALAGILTFLLHSIATGTTEPTPPRTEIFALEYARSLIRPQKWFCFLIKDSGRNILIDTGFNDPVLAKRWNVKITGTLTELLASINISEKDIDVLIITHAHLDHAAQIDLFPNATIYIQGATYQESLKNPVLKQTLQKRTAPVSLFTENCKVTPNLQAIRVRSSHAPGISIVFLKKGKNKYLFPSDLCYSSNGCCEKINKWLKRSLVSCSDKNLIILPSHADPESIQKFKNAHITIIPGPKP